MKTQGPIPAPRRSGPPRRPWRSTAALGAALTGGEDDIPAMIVYLTRVLKHRRSTHSGRSSPSCRGPGWRSAELAEESADVVNEQLRLLHRREVATAGHDGPPRQVGVLFGDRPREQHNVLREHSDRGGRLDRWAAGVGKGHRSSARLRI